MFVGISERLQRELTALVDVPVDVTAPPERNYSAWVGGSVIASLPTFEPHWITKDEYEEYGPGIVQRKCF